MLGSYLVGQMTPRETKIDLHLDKDLDWQQMAKDKAMFGLDNNDTPDLPLIASNDSDAITAVRRLKYLRDQRITELNEYGDITNIESDKNQIDVYIQSDAFHDFNAYKPNSGFMGRVISWTAMGDNGGTIGLVPDQAQEIQGLKDQLTSAMKDLEDSYSFLRISDSFIANRERKSVLSASAEFGMETDIFAEKFKLSSDSGFSFTVESGKLNSKTYPGLKIDTDVKLGFDNKGRLSIDEGLVKAKVPTFASDSDVSMKGDYKVSDWDSLGFEGPKAVLGWSLNGPNKVSVPGLGNVGLKLEAGFDLLEFSQRTIDPLATKVEKINLKLDIQNQIQFQIRKIDSLKYQIDNFSPKLKPVIIHVSTKDRA